MTTLQNVATPAWMQRFADAWCHMRRAFGEPISYNCLAAALREADKRPSPGWADYIDFSRLFCLVWLRAETAQMIAERKGQAR